MSALTALAASGSTVQTVFVAAMLALGYAIVFALWWFVFRERGE